MLVIRKKQMDLIQDEQRLVFEEHMLQHVQRYFPIDSALLTEAELRAVIRDGMRTASALSFHEQGQVCRYIDLTLAFGTDFAEDPLQPWAATCLAQHHGESGLFERVHDAALTHIERISGDTGLCALKAMYRARAMSFGEAADARADHGESTLRLLRRLWPQKYRHLATADLQRFLVLAEERAETDGMSTSGPRQLYTILMFLLGSAFSRDPALPWARMALVRNADADPDTRARALYDAGMDAIDRFLQLLPRATEN